MKIKVRFWSYFADLTGCKKTCIEVDQGITLGQLHEQVCEQFPELTAAKNSTLKVVDIDYQDSNFVLSDNNEVSFFPPVQGG
ncbi:MAG: MoaD/ThiS family protein [Verrucomicrobiota bacterium]|jgi:molybdopterin converting factor small subunit|nr:MoaD/ThiS family protein [Verrucomicrobiota bacterium]